MKPFPFCLLVLFCFSCSYSLAGVKNDLQVKHLLVESMESPLGVDQVNPRFSWQIDSRRRGVSQKVYQILAASSKSNLKNNIGDLWDSGEVVSSEQNHIKYAGKKLKPGTYVYWKVRIWDNSNQVSEWSSPSSWVTGMLSSDWKGKWISYNSAKATSLPLFKKVFKVKTKIKQAIIHISGLGYYELYMNGKKAGDHVLDPGQTNYDDYALYVTYDVTNLLKQGNNAVGVMLGDGWYNQNIVWGRNMSYGKPRLICELNITYDDGSVQQIMSDESWKWNNGPVIKSNLYAGEEYDARKEIKEWSAATDMESWMPVILSENNPPSLVSQSLPAIKVRQEIPTVKFYKTGKGKYIYDLGQNFAGWPRLRIKARVGDTIKLRMGEEVDLQGHLDTRSTGVNATKVEQVDLYICKSNAEEIWEPRFTYHGFRYVEVSGLNDTPNINLITGIVVSSAVHTVGSFECSDPQINRLHEMSVWTMLSNFHSIPTDCPTREKCGWLGDAHVITQASIYNFDMESFWIKYLYDIRSSGRDTATTIFHVLSNRLFRKGKKEAGIPYMISPGKRQAGVASLDWGTALVQLPWYIYQYYGNKEVLKTFYPDMKKWVEYTSTLAKGHIVSEGLGDWCPPGGLKPFDCPVPLSSTAFYYEGLNLLSKAAGVLGNRQDQYKYAVLRDSVKLSFINTFYNQEQASFGTQTADALALYFKLTPVGKAESVSYSIARESKNKYDGFMRTGFFGLSRIFGALSDYGQDQAAYQILTKKGDNSFEQMWKKYNATTFWEVLPVDDKYKDNPNGSHNHQMQAAFDSWCYDGILGIKPMEDQPGFKSVKLDPALTRQLSWAKGSYNSVYGPIVSEWQNQGGQFKWKVSIPANTSALVYIPAKSPDDVEESGRSSVLSEGVTFVKMEKGKAIFKIRSGNYSFVSNN